MRKSKVSSNSQLLGFDLLFQLSYMSAVAAAGLARSRLFQAASRLPSSVAPQFEKIHILAEKMGYDYPMAFRLVGLAAPHRMIKSLFLRISSSLMAGEAEQEFLEREARVQADTYGNDYEGKLESMRKYTDAYTAVTVSAALIIVVAVVSMLIYKSSVTFILALAGVAVAATGAGGWIIYQSAPRESKTLSGKEGPPKARLLARLFSIAVPLSLVLPALLALSGLPWGMILILAALPLLPLGLVASSYDREIDRKDSEVSTFLRALGSVATAIGSTLTEALDRLDLRSFPYLGPQVRQLHARLKASIDPALCWRRLVTDSGSALIDRSINIFQDAINRGGEAEEVGSRSSTMAMKVSFLRAKRHTVSSTFTWLTLAMHGTIAGLLVFIISIVEVFAGMVKGVEMGEIQGSFSFFSVTSGDMNLLHMILVPVLILFSVGNAFAIQAAEGGHKYRYFFFLSITLATAGASMLAVPAVVRTIFGFVSVGPTP